MRSVLGLRLPGLGRNPGVVGGVSLGESILPYPAPGGPPMCAKDDPPAGAAAPEA